MAKISPEGLDRAQKWGLHTQGAAFAWDCPHGYVRAPHLVSLQLPKNTLSRTRWEMTPYAFGSWPMVLFGERVYWLPLSAWHSLKSVEGLIAWIELTCGRVYKVSFQLLIDIEGPSLLWAIPFPRLMVPGSIRKSAELRPVSKQASKQHPPWFLPPVSFPGFRQMPNLEV